MLCLIILLYEGFALYLQMRIKIANLTEYKWAQIFMQESFQQRNERKR